MDISLRKTVRPTQLQPKLFSTVKKFAKEQDYVVVVNKDNEPMCVMLSYSLVKDIDLEKLKKSKTNNLAAQMKEYYSNISEEEKVMLNEAVDDGEI